MKFSAFVASALAATVKASYETKLTLLHINDHHSHLTEASAGYINIFNTDIPSSVSANNGGTTYIRAYYGGMPRLATAFKELQAEAESKGRDVLKLHAGDAITGTTFFTLFEGDADAKLMSHICFDAFAPGNHEFDKGDAGLAKFLVALDKVHGYCDCDMPAVLGANIVPHSNSPILAPGVPQIKKSQVFDLSSGGQVGVVGINIRSKTMNSSSPDPGTILLDEKETAQAEIDTLTKAGVKMIIVLTHIGYNYDIKWMTELNGVDVVIGGDSHSLLGDESTAVFGTPRGPYATEVTQTNGSKVCVVQAWDYSKVVGNLEVDFDADGNIMNCGGSPVFPFNPSRVTVRDANPRYDMSNEDAAAVMAQLSSISNGQARTFEEDEDAAADLEVYNAEVEILSQTVVATSSAFIPLEAGGYESGACDLVAQGFLLNPLSTADVSIQNRGGCRSSIQEGDFTVNDAYTLLPFSNTMFNLNMTGKQIKQVLEDAINFYLDPNGSWGAYPRASGLRFDVNEAMPFGSRVSNLEINQKLAGSWKAIDMAATYKVVTNNYIAGSKDGYFEFGNVDDSLKEDTFVEYAQSFIEYAQSVGKLVPVPADRASTQNWSNEAPDEFLISGPLGCLTAFGFNDQVRVKPCHGWKNQRFSVIDGVVKNVLHNKCFGKDRGWVALVDCDDALVFDYENGIASLAEDPSMVISAVRSHAKLLPRDEDDSNQIWTLVNV